MLSLTQSGGLSPPFLMHILIFITLRSKTLSCTQIKVIDAGLNDQLSREN